MAGLACLSNLSAGYASRNARQAQPATHPAAQPQPAHQEHQHPGQRRGHEQGGQAVALDNAVDDDDEGPRRAADLRVVDVYVARLRGKLEPDPRNPELILTVRGTGYASQRIGDATLAIAG